MNPDKLVLSEVEVAEAQMVMDALVRPWEHYGAPERDDRRPFHREHIAVTKVTIPGILYPMYVCVPRDIRNATKIDVQRRGKVSVSAPFIDIKDHSGGMGGTGSYLSVLLSGGGIVEAGEIGSLSHQYGPGTAVFVALPDMPSVPVAQRSKRAAELLDGCPIQAMILMCGFGRASHSEAHIAVFTQPIVK